MVERLYSMIIHNDSMYVSANQGLALDSLDPLTYAVASNNDNNDND